MVFFVIVKNFFKSVIYIAISLFMKNPRAVLPYIRRFCVTEEFVWLRTFVIARSIIMYFCNNIISFYNWIFIHFIISIFYKFIFAKINFIGLTYTSKVVEQSFIDCFKQIERTICFKCGKEGVMSPKCPRWRETGTETYLELWRYVQPS